MKKFLLFTFVFILSSANTYPQWTNQNPVPDGNHLWSTFFIDDTGWIVGNGGFIKKTTNAGVDWIQQTSGTTVVLKSVQFVNLNTGWICGEGGLILKTTNGGLNWFSLVSGTTAPLTEIDFYDLDIGYAVGFGGTILKTTDGGSSWTSLSSGTAVNLESVDFVDEFVGYAVGGFSTYALLKTTDGGASWIDKTSGINLSLYLLAVEFIDANTGFVGHGVQSSHYIHKTTDGGDTWTIVLSEALLEREEQLSNYNPGGINSIYFKDSNNGYAVAGDWGAIWYTRDIYTTTDGGSTWTCTYCDGYEETGLLSVYVNNAGKGWAVGLNGVIFITEDDGNSWTQILSGDNSPPYFRGDNIYSVFCINENVGWAVGERNRWSGEWKSIILKTTNGGKIWNTQFYSDFYRSIRSVYFINENIGWTVGDVLFRTTDGGQNWGHVGGGYLCIFFIDQNTGWASDPYSYLTEPGTYKSTDGGVTWVKKSSLISSSIYFMDINTGWAVGADGILKSTDGGETWVTKSSLTASYIRFYDSNVGMCVGGGAVLVSTDGGETWTSKSGPTLQTVNFTNSTTVWGYSSEGTVYKTNDFGDNWVILNTGLGFGQEVYFVNEYTGWICDENNIFKYSVEPRLPPVWTNQILVEDSSGTEASRVLTFGQHSEATDSIDSELGEYEIPPPPPALIFDARFNLPTNPLTSSLTDYRDSLKTEITWKMQFQPDNMAYPMTFTWDSTAFPQGTFYLKDLINQSYAFVNMKEQSSYTLTEQAITSLNISYGGNCSMVSVLNEWNMVSVPLLAVDMSLNNLFPTATSSAYSYDGSYVIEDTLDSGVGYWLKFGANEDIQICGAILGDTAQVQEGWNLFGGNDEDILVSQITTTPPGIVATFFFGFNDGYYIADTLKSGQGYWVRVTDDGVINLNGGTLSKDREQEQIAKIEQGWGRIMLTDSEGKSTTLYASEEEIESNLYELPPMPPRGIFDVRYSSGKFVEALSSAKTIIINSDKYPITIKAEGISLRIRDMIDGKILDATLKNGEELVITNNKITSIEVTGTITGGLPVSYELYQNYPNPFNPVTTIKFAVPKESQVNLNVFNILGERIAELVNQEMKAGYHQIEFDASHYASGVYLYRIKAGSFVEVKKMVLMK